ncbi:MAG: Lrp/AsnC family transcriptional regulator [Ardenticatenaceae bacterium]|nr:Lrp/AsnC family transcriptional regulator [Ardenticatenaceae bacterium]
MNILDALDYEIMALLAVDGRMSCTEMSRRLNQPARTIRHRMVRLLAGNVLHVRPIVNPAVFGYTILADVLIETEAGRVWEVATAVSQLNDVSYVACATGDRDVSVQVLARSVDSLYQFVTDKLHPIPGVRRTQTILLPIKLKDVYQWQPPNPYAA